MSCRGVRKVYAGAEPVVALDGLDLDVAAGEFLALVGESGSGKSTLLHLLGAIDRQTSGSIEVGGVDLAALSGTPPGALPPPRRRNGLPVLQPSPPPLGRDNVELPRRLDGGRDAATRAAELLDRVGLSRRGAAHPYELSGGEMQRVAIARALVTGARLLLADEPTGNLDSRNGEQVLTLLDEVRRERGVTLLLATHSAQPRPLAPTAIASRSATGGSAPAARIRGSVPARALLLLELDRAQPHRRAPVHRAAAPASVVSGFSLVFRGLVWGPARRHPMRLVLPAAGVAIGVAAVAAIHHANRSVTESFREAAASVSGRSDFVVTGVAGFPSPTSPRSPSSGGSPPSRRRSPAPRCSPTARARCCRSSAWTGAATRRCATFASSEPTPPPRARASSPRAAPCSSRLLSPPGTGCRPGGTIAVVAGGRRREVRVGGILELSGVARATGGDLLLTDLFTAQDLLGRPGRVDRVDIVLDRDVSRDAARRAIAARLPAGLSLEPPGRAAETADRMVRAFRFNLNALGSLTLLVGMFLIANAVSIAVLRRRPEIATLRALGASRGSVFTAFLLEGLVVGAVGTLVGRGARRLRGAGGALLGGRDR